MIFSRLFAATPENPKFSLHDPQAWDLLIGGQAASSGVRVTPETALSYAPWWRGINLVSADVGKLPLLTYKYTPNGKTPDRLHPAWRLLRRKPNEYHLAFGFKQLLVGHALQRGNGYAFIERNGAGRPTALLPLSPDDVIPARENGRLLYVVNVAGEQRKIAAEDIFHVRGFSFDGLIGYAVYEKAAESIGLGIGARKYGAVFLRNNARPNLAIEVPRTLSDEQRRELRAGWESMQGGLDNAHKIAILSGGAKLNPFSINARDSQILETRQFEIREIALWIGVPPHKLGDSTKANYNTLEQENQDYLDAGLDPWLVRIEEECWDKLLSEEEKQRESHEILFVRRALTRANLADRANYYQKATGNRPWMLPDEVREEEDMETLGGDAATLKDPANVAPPRPQQPEEPPPPKRVPNPGAAAVIQDATRRMVRRLAHAAAGAARKPAEFMSWLDAIDAEERIIEEAFAPAAGLVGASPAAMAGELLAAVKLELLDAAGGTKASGLADAVAQSMTAIEINLPRQLADKFGDAAEKPTKQITEETQDVLARDDKGLVKTTHKHIETWKE